MENINESSENNMAPKSNEQNKSSKLHDYFLFKKMISLTLIQIIYGIGVFVIILSGIGMIANGADTKYGGDEMIWLGIGMLTLGNISWRLVCEGWILFFRLVTLVSNIDKNCRK